MKVAFIFQKNNSSNPQRKNITFEAGLTPKMMQEIQKNDVLEISKKLAKKGVSTDFKENKVVAWCCDKTIEIFEQLNEFFGQKLALPKGIFVKDFGNLNINNPSIMGFCNPFPSYDLIKNSNTQVNGETLFFNTFESLKTELSNKQYLLTDWKNINNIADYNYSQGFASTNHFLDLFIHEFAHVAHEDRLLNRVGEINLRKNIKESKNEIKISNYQHKYGKKISEICNHAVSNPFEAVACDMARNIVISLDKETLMPTINPFVGTPYERTTLLQRINIPYYTDEQRPLNEILRNFWNGKFD